jgi:hypothetical protein
MKGINSKIPANRAKSLKPDPLTASAHCSRGLACNDKGDIGHVEADFDMAKELEYK